MLVCKEAARLISASYQRPLRWRERVALRMHLAMCDACRNFEKQMKLLTDAARRLALREDTYGRPQLAAAARRRISARLAAWRGNREET